MSTHEDAFNKSGRTPRTPQKGDPPKSDKTQTVTVATTSTKSKGGAQSIRSQTLDASLLPYLTKDAEVACNKCEVTDTHTKLLCKKCKRWWHLKCDKGKPPFKNEIISGRWICEVCSKSEDESNKPEDLTKQDDSNDVTRTNLTDKGLLGESIAPLINQNSTKVKVSAKSITSMVSSHSRRSSIKSKLSLSSQEQLELVDKDLELARKQLEMEAEISRIKIRRNEIKHQREEAFRAICSQAPSEAPSIDEFMETASERRRSIEIWQNWLAADGRDKNRETTGVKPKSSHVKNTKEAEINSLNADDDPDDFINKTLHAQPEANALNLSRAQVNARQVVSRDLPSFNGDPRE